MSRSKVFFLAGFLFLFTKIFSQPHNFFLDRDKILPYDKYFNNKESKIHTGIKPFLSSELSSVFDSLNINSKKRKWNLSDGREFGTTDSAKYHGSISISPLLLISEGISLDSSDILPSYAAGAILLANYKDKLALNVNFLAGTSSFPSSIDSIVKQTRIVPGIGRGYYKENGIYSWQYYSGYLSYSPNRIFNFQIGRDKHFWGDGYRSLFLSDNASPIPFFKITTNIWKLKYVSMYAMVTDATNPTNAKKDFKTKYGTFHMLSWNVSKRVNINLFESIMWQGSDSNRTRSFDVNYLNPVIFFRPVEYSLGSSDNAFLGVGYKIKVARNQQFYGQILLDEFLLKEYVSVFKKIANPFDSTVKYGWWANKQAYQFGFRSFDLFTVKKLDFLTEVNIVRPFTYAHGSVQQNYGHLNQPLAHPLGANFTEWVSAINYQYKDFMFEVKYTTSVRGVDTSGKNFGGNIFKSYSARAHGDYFYHTGDGLRVNTSIVGLLVCYVFRPLNGRVELGFSNRTETSAEFSRHTPFVYFGIRTYFGNLYSDY